MNSKFCIKEYQNIKSLGDSEQNDDDLQDTGRKSNESRLQGNNKITFPIKLHLLVPCFDIQIVFLDRLIDSVEYFPDKIR
ncbi:hypothetical protein GWI33_010312, partial [Rhynchophorus ferrugineus]